MEELDLKELFKIFWNRKIRILIIVLIFLIIGIVYSTCFVTPKYTSSTTLVLASSNSNSSSDDTSITATDLTVNSKLIATYSELVKSKNVLREVLYNLDIDVSEEVLRKNVTVTSVKNTDLIKITVSDENKYYATEIANEIAEVFMEKVKSIYNIENIQVVDKAENAKSPSNINYKRDIIIFVIGGMAIAVFYVLIENMLDTTVKTVEEIESAYQVPVLASIPMYEEEAQKTKKEVKNNEKGINYL